MRHYVVLCRVLCCQIRLRLYPHRIPERMPCRAGAVGLYLVLVMMGMTTCAIRRRIMWPLYATLKKTSR